MSARAELLRRIETMSDDEAANVLAYIEDLECDYDTITDEEYEENLRRLAEMKAGNYVRWEDLKRELNL